CTLGKRMLNRELERFDLSIDTLDPERLANALKSFNLASFDELLGNIGLGVRPAPLVARVLVPVNHEERVEPARRRGRADSAPGPLLIHGTEGMVVTIPKCCYPIPGDPIMGFITAGRGIVIHHPSCKNVVEFRNAPDKWVDVEWAANLDREFSAEIVLDVANQRGVLATVAAGCADQSANIEGIELSERDEHYSHMRLIVGVRDRKHLADVIRVLRNIKTVVRVHRKRA
ncbi:MAG: ACT domain-containing protein, partial [Gammaproteobacteria bacterium]